MSKFRGLIAGAALSLLSVCAQADTKISALPSAVVQTGTELLAEVQSGTTVAVLLSQIKAWFNWNQIDLCTMSGIDPLGATDSRANVATQFGLVAGTGQKLVANCPIKIHTGSDGTLPIFVASQTPLTMGANGKFIVDNICVNSFVFVNSTKSLWDGVNIEYIANFGATAIAGPNWGPCASGVNTEGPVLEAYLVNNFGNTFSGGAGAAWYGPTMMMPIIAIRGASSALVFRNLKVSVPAGTSAANFPNQVVGFYPEWIPNYAVIGSQTALVAPYNYSPTLMNIPTDIEFDHPVFDGYGMGYQGSGSARFIHPVFKRYSDVQDGTPGTVTFASIGTTSAVLSSSVYTNGWPYGTGQFCLTMGGTGQVVGMAMTQGNWTANAFFNCASSGTVTPSSLTVTGTPTLVATSGNVGGYNNAFPPPHAFYLLAGQVPVAPLVPGWPFEEQIYDADDEGIWVGLPTRRSAGSGTALSLKLEADQGTIVDGYTSKRMDGWLDLEQSFGGVFRNVNVFYDSSLATSNGGFVWGARFPGPGNFGNLIFDNISITDVAANPTRFPWETIGNQSTYDVSMTNMRVFLNNWGGSWSPGFEMQGQHNHLQGEIHFVSTTSTTGFRGSFAESIQNELSDSTVDLDIYGWRQYPVTFASPLTANATHATLSTAWPLSSGTYKFFFPDGEIRWVAMTNNSTSVPGTGNFTALSDSYSVTWATAPASGATSGALSAVWPQLGGTYTVILSNGQTITATLAYNSTAVTGFSAAVSGTITTAVTVNAIINNAVAGGALQANYSTYKNRVITNFSGTNPSNMIHIRDVDNMYESWAYGLGTKECMSEEYFGIATTPSPLVFPTSYSIDQTAFAFTTAPTGITGTMGVGFASATGALIPTATIAVANAGNPIGIPVTSPGTPITLTPSSGTLTAGNASLYAHGCTSLVTH